MAKHYQQQPLPRPTAPPTAVAPKPQAPEVRLLALGRTADGRHAAAILRTQGMRVLECRLLGAPSRDAMPAEETWRDAAYAVLYHGKEPATVDGPPLTEGMALGLHKFPDSKFGAVQVTVSGKALLVVRNAAPVEGEDISDGVWFKGGKLDAWNELDSRAAHHLLVESKQERRRRRATEG